MNLTQMRYFYEVCLWQNITRAAEALHVSQPTVSLAIQSLEAETGLNLFRRSGKKILISRDGNILLAKIKPILEAIGQLDNDISVMAQRTRPLRIALPPQIGLRTLPLLLGEFHRQNPQIKLEIIETDSTTALQLLKNDKLELVLMNYEEDYTGGFTYRRLGKVECCFCTWPEHPLAGRSRVSLEEIAREPFVLLDTTFFNITHLVQQIFTAHSCEANVLHYTPYLHTVRNIIRQQIASSFLTRQAIMPNDEIVAISLTEPIYLESGIISKKGRQQYAGERALLKFLKDNF